MRSPRGTTFRGRRVSANPSHIQYDELLNVARQAAALGAQVLRLGHSTPCHACSFACINYLVSVCRLWQRLQISHATLPRRKELMWVWLGGLLYRPGGLQQGLHILHGMYTWRICMARCSNGERSILIGVKMRLDCTEV